MPEKKTTTAPQPEKTTQGQQGRRAAEEGQTGSTNSHNHRDLEGRKVDGEGRGREGEEHAGSGGSRSPESGSTTAQWIRSYGEARVRAAAAAQWTGEWRAGEERSQSSDLGLGFVRGAGAGCLPASRLYGRAAGGGQEAKAPLALAAGPLAGRAGAESCCRADLGPTAYYRAGPGQPAGLRNGPGTACSCVPGQPGPRDPRAGPDSCRVKLAGRGPGYRASGCMAKYTFNSGLFSSLQSAKFFKIFRHIESLDACMKH